MADTENAAGEWELSKENVQPLRRGRKVAELNSALGAKSEEDRAAKIEEQKKAFWDAINNYEGDDPLETWLRFIKWAQETFPAGGHQAELVPLLEKCTRDLQKVEKYKNDVRYLRVWIQYADSCTEPRDIFRFLQHNGIGQDFALFYEAYATFLEFRGSFNSADQVYRDGLDRRAQPYERLSNKFQAFQHRMAKRIQRKLEEERDLGIASDPLDGSGGPGGGLDENGRPAAPGREAFHRGGQPAGPAAAGAQAGGFGSKRKAGPTPPKGNRPAGGGFEVFVDEELAGGGAAGAGPSGSRPPAPAAPWTELGTVDGAKKENTQQAASWGGARVSQKRSKAVPAAPELEIFEDDDVAEAEAARALEATRREAAGKGGPTLRERLDRAGPSSDLGHNPLLRHGADDPPPPAAAAAPSAEGAKEKGGRDAKGKKEKKEEVPGYDAELLVGEDGEEACFEERRAALWMARNPAAFDLATADEDDGDIEMEVDGDSDDGGVGVNDVAAAGDGGVAGCAAERGEEGEAAVQVEEEEAAVEAAAEGGEGDEPVAEPEEGEEMTEGVAAAASAVDPAAAAAAPGVGAVGGLTPAELEPRALNFGETVRDSPLGDRQGLADATINTKEAFDNIMSMFADDLTCDLGSRAGRARGAATPAAGQAAAAPATADLFTPAAAVTGAAPGLGGFEIYEDTEVIAAPPGTGGGAAAPPKPPAAGGLGGFEIYEDTEVVSSAAVAAATGTAGGDAAGGGGLEIYEDTQILRSLEENPAPAHPAPAPRSVLAEHISDDLDDEGMAAAEEEEEGAGEGAAAVPTPALGAAADDENAPPPAAAAGAGAEGEDGGGLGLGFVEGDENAVPSAPRALPPRGLDDPAAEASVLRPLDPARASALHAEIPSEGVALLGARGGGDSEGEGEEFVAVDPEEALRRAGPPPGLELRDEFEVFCDDGGGDDADAASEGGVHGVVTPAEALALAGDAGEEGEDVMGGGMMSSPAGGVGISPPRREGSSEGVENVRAALGALSPFAGAAGAPTPSASRGVACTPMASVAMTPMARVGMTPLGAARDVGDTPGVGVGGLLGMTPLGGPAGGGEGAAGGRGGDDTMGDYTAQLAMGAGGWFDSFRPSAAASALQSVSEAPAPVASMPSPVFGTENAPPPSSGAIPAQEEEEEEEGSEDAAAEPLAAPEGVAVAMDSENVPPPNAGDAENVPPPPTPASEGKGGAAPADENSAPVELLASGEGIDPFDPATVAAMLSSVDPPVQSWDGVSEHGNAAGGELSAALRSLKAGARPSPSGVEVAMGSHTFSVRACVGEGAYARVYLARPGDDSGSAGYDSDEDDDSALAIKVQDPGTALWEMCAMRAARGRLAPRDLPLVAEPRQLLLGGTRAAALVLPFLPGGSLQDALNCYLASGQAMDEVLVAYYAAEVVRVVRALHAAGIVHADLKPDNLLLRDESEDWDEWGPGRPGSWALRGLTAIDFGRAVDLTLLPSGARMVGDSGTDGFRCPQMAGSRPWRYEADTFAAAGVIHCLLFGSYMEAAEEAGGALRPRQPFKRYWAVELWGEVFDGLMNQGGGDGEGGPPLEMLDALVGRIEGYIAADYDRARKLKALLCKQRILLRNRSHV